MTASTRGLALLLALLVGAGPASGQTKEKPPGKGKGKQPPATRPAKPRPPAAPVALPEAPELALPEGPRVTLAQALATTLERHPQVEMARQEVRRARGFLQQAEGRFDPLLSFAPSFERKRSFLTLSQLRGQIAQREFLSTAAEDLAEIADQVAAGLADKSGTFLPDCHGSTYYINGFPICTQNISPTDYQSFQLLQDAQDATAGTSISESYSAQLQMALNQHAAAIVALIRQVFVPALAAQLAAIGALPTALETDDFILDLRLVQPFRNGTTVAPVLYLEGTRTAFTDKPDSPAAGGTGVPTLYRAVLGLSVETPLLRGAGTGSTAAAERAARHQVAAAEEVWAQTASDALLGTTIAYWNLAASQELQKLLGKASATQRRIGEVARALVQGDELPRAELAKVDAQTADSEAAALQAARAVVAARVELARAMGIDVSRIEEAPLAADPIPAAADVPVPSGPEIAALATALPDTRAEVRGAHRRVEAARVLERAARLELRPRLDLSLQAGWNAIWEDGSFKTTSVLAPKGYGKALGGWYVGPSATVSLRLELPFWNNTQRGRLVTAEVGRERAEIFARDAERRALNQVREVAASLPSVRREVAARETATAEAEKTVGVASARLRAGETTLLDAILSERSRTQRFADLLAARQTLVLKAARLRWAAGTLLPVTRDPAGEIRFGAPGR